MTLPPTPDGVQKPCESLTVMFDGACPLCQREVGIYQGLKPAQPVAWLDVSQASVLLTPEDRARYLARFHVRREDGSLLSGAAAFVALWRVMPGWRWLARFAMLPVLRRCWSSSTVDFCIFGLASSGWQGTGLKSPADRHQSPSAPGF